MGIDEVQLTAIYTPLLDINSGESSQALKIAFRNQLSPGQNLTDFPRLPPLLYYSVESRFSATISSVALNLLSTL